MSKNKLKKFEELESFERVFQPSFEDFFDKDFELKGKWNRNVFGNDQPLVLELGCGKGEYTIGLARTFNDMNFLGVDIKGSRIWQGAKTSHLEGITNSAFL
ncbi:MAG TPA: tRNA (guanosine(46)-N7)-methyltransferase TrmB, partial [Bacteroidales bacterium]|nr:tRNA (guanosine(46)-N7)-methyltransferase TrmB [Bacteroidales bacterium]